MNPSVNLICLDIFPEPNGSSWKFTYAYTGLHFKLEPADVECRLESFPFSKPYFIFVPEKMLLYMQVTEVTENIVNINENRFRPGYLYR